VRATLDVPQKVSVSSVAISPDSRLLATANSDETVRLWNVANGHLVHELHTGPVYCATFSPDGSLLATGGAQAVKLWDVATKQELIALEGSGWLRVNAVAFSPDGRALASGSADRYVRIWDDVPAAVRAGKSSVKTTLIPIKHADAKKVAESIRKVL